MTQTRTPAWGNLLATLIGALLMVAAFAFMWWRAQYGVELYDEPFYLAPGFKLYSMGDVPLRHEIHNGPRQYDVLNHAIARPFLPFSVLVLRRAAIVVYALLLFAFTALCFRGTLGVLAGLVFFSCLTYDYFLLPTWSHNWWVRNLFLIHHCLWLLAFRIRDERWLKPLVGLAGVVLGAALFAYQPLAVGVVAVIVGVAFLGFFPTPLRTFRKYLVAYSGGLAIATVVAGVFFLKDGFYHDWLAAVSSVIADYQGGKKLGGEKIRAALSHSFLNREVWLLWLLALTAFFPRSHFPSRFRPTVRVWEIMRAGSLALIFMFLIKRFFDLDFLFMVSALFTALLTGGAIILIFRGMAQKSPVKVFLSALSLVVALNMSFVSHNSHHTLFWMVPLVALPLVAEFWAAAALTRGKAESAAIVLLLMWFTAVSAGAVKYGAANTYFDGTPTECKATLRTPPLQGIRTSIRRAELIEHLARTVENRRFVLSVGLPGVFLFSSTRSATNSTILNTDFPDALALSGLRTLWRDRRFPDLIVREKERSWGWGLIHDPIQIRADHPYLKFEACAGKRVAISFPEWQAVEVSAEKVESCLAQVLGEQRVL